jgi:hypothetical protein
LSQGLLADLTALDHARLAHRLEALVAADSLADASPGATLLPLRKMFLLERKLAAVPSVSARLLAAQLRSEALQVMAATVAHEGCTRPLRHELAEVLEKQLASWTPDRVAWVGDRALGLHAYELVRDGQLINILTDDELTHLQRGDDLQAFAGAVLQGLDDDQWFYLSAMRRIVDACDRPYFQRLTVLEEIQQELEGLENTPRYPRFAATVLLPQLARAQRAQARDRARCEAWMMALRAALDQPVDDSARNPLTGEAYVVTREADCVVVEIGADEQDESRIVVPLVP